MENLFWGRDISRIYDLKGSVRNRYADVVDPASKTGGESDSVHIFVKIGVLCCSRHCLMLRLGHR